MKRVLVIDDDVHVRAMLGQMVGELGYEAVLAADGWEGVRAQEANPAAAVLTDLYMPGMDGLEMLVEFRRRFPVVPVIAMSGAAGGWTMLQVAERLGAAAVLAKPFDQRLLGQKLWAVLGGKT